MNYRVAIVASVAGLLGAALFACSVKASGVNNVPPQPPPVVMYQPPPPPLTERVMVMRAGPGIQHLELGVTVPAGDTVMTLRCLPRDDGIYGPPWCLVSYRGMTGWISSAGLM